MRFMYCIEQSRVYPGAYHWAVYIRISSRQCGWFLCASRSGVDSPAQRSFLPSPKYRNLILAGLPPPVLRRLGPHLKKLNLPQGKTLTMPNRSVRFAYFLESGLASIVTTMTDGTSVEVAVVGREGMAGIPVVLDSVSMPNRTFMQIGGSGHRLEAAVLVAEYQRSSELRHKITHYVHAHLVQASQTAACNRLH